MKRITGAVLAVSICLGFVSAGFCGDKVYADLKFTEGEGKVAKDAERGVDASVLTVFEKPDTLAWVKGGGIKFSGTGHYYVTVPVPEFEYPKLEMWFTPDIKGMEELERCGLFQGDGWRLHFRKEKKGVLPGQWVIKFTGQFYFEGGVKYIGVDIPDAEDKNPGEFHLVFYYDGQALTLEVNGRRSVVEETRPFPYSGKKNLSEIGRAQWPFKGVIRRVLIGQAEKVQSEDHAQKKTL